MPEKTRDAGREAEDRFETFATAVAQINRCLQKIKAAEMDAVGLRSAHVMCLYALGKERAGLTAAQLCRTCREDKAAVSRSVNELAEKGYIRLEERPGGRAYRAKIFLTERGEDIVRYINGRVDRALDAVGEVLDDGRRSAFYSALTQIADRLERYAATIAVGKAPGGVE